MMSTPRTTAVEGTALPLRGDDIDTDRIIPARYLRAITFEGMEEHVFEDDRAEMRAAGRSTTLTARRSHPFDDPRFQTAAILIVNRNFGCGSSREHAPQALQRRGIRAVVGESFSDIFFGNAAAIGLPCVTGGHEDIELLMEYVEEHPSTTIRVDLAKLACEWEAGAFAIDMPASAREAYVTGAWDTTGLLLERYDEVRAVADRLPYLTGFQR
jgi:3-isopropylmalate/(R)-2-methylmalate dehydratase small subunit